MSALPADWRLGGEWPGGQPTRAAEENQGPGQGPCGMRRKTGERGRGRPAGPGPGGPSCPGVPGICSELRAKEPAVTLCSFRTPFRLPWSPPLGSPGDAPERTTGPHRADPQHLPHPTPTWTNQQAPGSPAVHPGLATCDLLSPAGVPSSRPPVHTLPGLKAWLRGQHLPGPPGRQAGCAPSLIGTPPARAPEWTPALLDRPRPLWGRGQDCALPALP